jgi:hypothetical protein
MPNRSNHVVQTVFKQLLAGPPLCSIKRHTNDVPWSGGSDDIARASVAQFCTILLRMVDPTVVAVTSAASRRRTCLWVRKDQMTVRFTAGDLKKRQKKALKPPFLGVRAGCCRKRKGGGEE